MGCPNDIPISSQPLNLISTATNLCNLIPAITQIENGQATDSSTTTITQPPDPPDPPQNEKQSIWGNFAYSSSSSSNSSTPQKTNQKPNIIQPTYQYKNLPPGYDLLNPFEKQANSKDNDRLAVLY